MQGTKEIKRRIKSVKSTKKITKAMELVAASKMRRAVAATLASRLYATYSWELLTSLSAKLEEITHPFFVEKKEGRTLLALITSNGSLCGGYNSQVIKKAVAMLRASENSPVDIVAIGKKGDAAMRRVGQNVLATFTDLPAAPTLRDAAPISSFLISEFKKGTYKNVYVGYTDFLSALSQKPNIRRLLPVSKAELKETIDSLQVTSDQSQKLNVKGQMSSKASVPYLLEGDPQKLIESLA